MDLRKFSEMNRQRCTDPNGFNHDMRSWSPAEWTNAVAGEAGEACNFAKKLIRHRDNVAGNIKPEDRDIGVLIEKTAKELADAIIYADLAIQSLGFNTAEMLAKVFNAKSEEIGCRFKVGP